MTEPTPGRPGGAKEFWDTLVRPLRAAVTDVPQGRRGRQDAAERYIEYLRSLAPGELRRWERAVIALHEAGHAVVATATGLRVDHVTLGARKDADPTGARAARRFCRRTCPAGPHAAPADVARWERLAEAAAVLERWVDRQLDRLAPVGTASPGLVDVLWSQFQLAERLAELAVTVAGLVAVGHVTAGVGVLSVAGSLAIGDADGDGAKVVLFRRFLRQVQPPGGPGVEQVVHAVADDFLRQAYCMAATIVDDEWEAVRQVAEALFRDGALSGKQVEALLEGRLAAWEGSPEPQRRAMWARWTGQGSHRPEAWTDYRHEAQDVLDLLDTLERAAAPALEAVEAVEAERSRRRSRRRRPAETPPADPAHPA